MWLDQYSLCAHLHTSALRRPRACEWWRLKLRRVLFRTIPQRSHVAQSEISRMFGAATNARLFTQNTSNPNKKRNCDQSAADLRLCGSVRLYPVHHDHLNPPATIQRSVRASEGGGFYREPVRISGGSVRVRVCKKWCGGFVNYDHLSTQKALEAHKEKLCFCVNTEIQNRSGSAGGWD